MSVALMSRGGLNRKVRFSVQDFEIWMLFWGGMTAWWRSLQMRQQKVDATFAAVIGTPVPAVIATDYLALKRMSEKKINLPILTVDTDGMEHYDKGEEKAFLELFKTFAVEKYPGG